MQNSEFKIATYRELRAFTHYIELQGGQKKRGYPNLEQPLGLYLWGLLLHPREEFFE